MILAICGYGRHGKGAAAVYLSARTGLRYRESTSFAAQNVVFEQLKDQYGYATPEACWDDRHNHRQEWAEIIWTYNQPDGLTLYREMLADNDILEGIRKAGELEAARQAGILDLTLWVDASGRLPEESTASCQIRPEDCDIVIDNNQTLEHLYQQLDYVIDHVLPQYGTLPRRVSCPQPESPRTPDSTS